MRDDIRMVRDIMRGHWAEAAVELLALVGFMAGAMALLLVIDAALR